jgi:hypothetical protein
LGAREIEKREKREKEGKEGKEKERKGEKRLFPSALFSSLVLQGGFLNSIHH